MYNLHRDLAKILGRVLAAEIFGSPRDLGDQNPAEISPRFLNLDAAKILPRFLNLGGQNPAEISRNLGGQNPAEISKSRRPKSCPESRWDP